MLNQFRFNRPICWTRPVTVFQSNKSNYGLVTDFERSIPGQISLFNIYMSMNICALCKIFRRCNCVDSAAATSRCRKAANFPPLDFCLPPLFLNIKVKLADSPDRWTGGPIQFDSLFSSSSTPLPRCLSLISRRVSQLLCYLFGTVR